VGYRGRTVLAMNCVLAGAEWHRGRPLNSVVRRHRDMSTNLQRLASLGYVAIALCAPIHAQTVRPSGELGLNVFGDYFGRYFCLKRFPELRSSIDQVYFRSSLRRIVVPCNELECSSPELERDLKKLWELSKATSEAEARKVCEADYERVSHNTQRQYAAELETIPWGTNLIQAPRDEQ
jgi:hypothetical protein